MANTAVDDLLSHSGIPPRADARRNLGRLVAAARDAVDEVGLDVTAHEIARRAGVGVGTLYRRVGSREVLLEAVSRELIQQIIDVADEALTDEDPWDGFCTFAEQYVRLRAASCGVNDALGGAHRLDLGRPLATIRRRLKAIVQRAQHSGDLRSDVDWRDVPFVLAGVLTPARSIGLTARREQWRTTLSVALDGLRAPQAVAPVRR